MATWAEFERQEHELAERGRALIYAGGSGFAFIATARADGAPRIHPVSVAIGQGGMFITPPDNWPPHYSRWREKSGTDHPVAAGYALPGPPPPDR